MPYFHSFILSLEIPQYSYIRICNFGKQKIGNRMGSPDAHMDLYRNESIPAIVEQGLV